MLFRSGHMAKDCYKKQNDIMSGKLQQGNYASSSRQGDDRNEHLFMVQHMTNSMTKKKATMYGMLTQVHQTT